jgi:hypothetical protein
MKIELLKSMHSLGDTQGKSITKDTMTSYRATIIFCHQKDNKISRINEIIQSPFFNDLNCGVF